MCIWNMAADTFGFDDQYITDIVYANGTITHFLQAKNSMGIAACKGMQNYFPSNLIINGAETFVKEDQIVRAQHLADALLGNTNDKRVFLTSTERDLKNVRIHIKTLLERQGYEVMMFEEADFPAMPTDKTGIAATHDHCIDVVLSCKHLVYIYMLVALVAHILEATISVM